MTSSQTVGNEWFSLVVDREIETLRLMNDSWVLNYRVGVRKFPSLLIL
jgi:hypothetical protein